MNSRGLTFIEIVVIVLILLIVAAILFPVTTDHGGRPFKSRCLTHLKQLGLASIMYSADYDDRAMDRDQWMDVLVPYHKNPSIEHCPTVQSENKENPKLYGYSFNSLLSRQNLAKFPKPAESIMLYDSSNLARNASDPLLSLPTPGRHEGEPRRNMVCYADGHGKILPDTEGPER